jgi:hypothetical protein
MMWGSQSADAIKLRFTSHLVANLNPPGSFNRQGGFHKKGFIGPENSAAYLPKATNKRR